jgi:uncharacterized protein YdeI (BOF family)
MNDKITNHILEKVNQLFEASTVSKDVLENPQAVEITIQSAGAGAQTIHMAFYEDIVLQIDDDRFEFDYSQDTMETVVRYLTAAATGKLARPTSKVLGLPISKHLVIKD